MKLTFYGHACFGVDINGKNILFDPFISGNPLVKDFDLSQLNPDYILLTHGHADHVLDTEEIAKNSGATVVSNYEIVTWYEKKGLKGHPMNHGGKWNFDFGTVKYVNAVHSSTMPDGSTGGNPGGFVVWNDDVCFYHAGDTALTVDMQLIPIMCPQLDVAILPIGDNFTMDYKDARVAAEMIECKTIIGCHHSTFGFIEIDKDAAIKHFAEAGIQLIIPNIGESIEI